MDLDDPLPRSAEGTLVSLSMLSEPYFGDSPPSESSVTTRMITTFEPLHQDDAPTYSCASDGLPFTVLHPLHRLADDTIHNSLQLHFSSQEQQDMHKQTLGLDLYTDASSNKPAEDYNISDCSHFNVDSSINPSVCATTDDFDVATRQPTRSPSNHQLIDVGVSSINNESSILPSLDLETRDIDIQEYFACSPPLSPSMSSAYMPSSSPIPSSSPVGPSFQTPPTSPPSSPVKDTQSKIWRSDNEPLIPGTHRKYMNVPVGEGCTTTPSSDFGDHDGQSIIWPEVSPLQHQVSILSPSDHYVGTSGITTTAVENSSNTIVTMALSDATTINTEGEDELSKETDVKKQRPNSNFDGHRPKSTNTIPYPKRPTIAAHRLQQKKLAQPFRSPLLPQALKAELKPKASATDLREDMVASRLSPKTSQEHVPSSSPTVDNKTKYRTTRAATQFKSPLSTPNTFDDSSLVRLTPTIQALERKLQILKRAVKVREDVQEEILEGLVKKWSEAGREVAWEVWNLVKDNVNSEGGYESRKKRAFEGSWGWESSGEEKRQRDDEEKERNWGWDIVSISNLNEEEAKKPSLGTMLMQLGVAPDTLGWNEEEGSFIHN